MLIPNKSIFILLLCVSIFITCKKETKDENNVSESVLDYYPLKTGNYWVYETSFYDSGMVFMNKASVNDSIVVGSKISKNGKEYFQLQHFNYMGTSSPQPYITNVRDSANCIVNEFGVVLFSLNSNEVKEYLKFDGDTIYVMKKKFIPELNRIRLKAGEFDAVNYSNEIEIRTNGQKRIQVLNQLYAKGVGQLTRRAIYVAIYDLVYQDLVSYKVEK